MKKRIFAFLMCVVLMIGVMPVSAMAIDVLASGKCGDNLSWEINEFGTLEITGSGKMYDYNDLYVQWDMHRFQVERIEIGADVTEVNRAAFAIFHGIRELVVDDDNKHYSSDSYGVLFNKDKTELLRIPDEIMPTTYIIPDGVTKIADHAVWNCELRELIIPASVEEMADTVFGGCLRMTDIIVAEGNEYFSSGEDGALYNKDKTELIYKPAAITGVFTVPAEVTKIANSALSDTGDLSALRFEGDPPKFDGDNLNGLLTVAFYPGNNPKWTKSVMEALDENAEWFPCDPSVPDSELSLSGRCGNNLTWKYTIDGDFVISGSGAMWDYSDSPYMIPGYYVSDNGPCNVIIEEGVTDISANALNFTYQISTIHIPASVTYIADGAFEECYYLKNLIIDENNPNYSSDDSGVLFNKDKTVLLEAPSQLGDYAIPDGVETVKEYAFDCGEYFTELTIPASVTNIEENAIYECYNLEKFVVAEENESYSSDEKGILYNKDKSELVKVPEGIEGNYVIPASVEKINGYACTDVFGFDEAIKFEGDAPVIEENAFYGISATIYYPADNDTWTDDVMKNYGGDIMWIAYDADDPNALSISGTYGDNFKWKFGFDGVLTITGEGMFEAMDSAYPWEGLEDEIHHVVFEEGITGFDDYVSLANIWGLKTVSIPASMTEIPIDKEIGPITFCDCGNLEKIIVDKNNPNYSSDEYGVLFNKDKTTLWMMPTSCVNGSYAIPDGVEFVYHWAFYGNYGVTEIVIPESLERMGYYSLGYCYNLEKIVVDEDNKYFSSDEQGVLYNKDKSNIEFVPAGMEGTLVVPSSVKSIEWHAFTYEPLSHDRLEKIVFEGDAPDYIAGLNYITIYYPMNNETWDDEAIELIGGANNTWIAYNLQGDVDGNGELSNTDLIMVARYIVELYDEDAVADIEAYGDMNGDGIVTNIDLITMARTIVGLE